MKSSFKFTGIIANTSKKSFLSFCSPRFKAPGRSSNGSLIVLFNNNIISDISSNGLSDSKYNLKISLNKYSCFTNLLESDSIFYIYFTVVAKLYEFGSYFYIFK